MKLTFDGAGLKIRVDLRELAALRNGERISGGFAPTAREGLRWQVSLGAEDGACWRLEERPWEIQLPRSCADRLWRKAEQGAGRKDLTEPCGGSEAVLELDFFDLKKGRKGEKT